MHTTETGMVAPVPFPWHRDQWDRVCSQLEQGRLAHSYLIGGERGLGKQAFAQSLARLLLCESPRDRQPCNRCRSCNLASSESNPDLVVIEPEEDSQVIKIGQIRELKEFISVTSHAGLRKIVLIKRAETLNISASNSLLKTLEEPAGNTSLLLLSDVPGRLLATIRSRCQRLQFVTPERRVSLHWLAEQLPDDSDPGSLLDMANGKPRAALELVQSEQYEKRRVIQGALVGLMLGKLDPVEFAAQWRSIDVVDFLEQLWRLTGDLAKGLASHQIAAPASTSMRAFSEALSMTTRNPDDVLARLLELNQGAEEARRMTRSGSNPNRQLVLESIAWRWSRLIH